MPYQAINLADKQKLIDRHWSPKNIATMNDYLFKLAKIEGDFIWHDHPETDETFIVLDGEVRIDFRDGAITLKAGEMFVMPKGVEHKPFAEQEAQILLIEPKGTLNTGNAGGDRTAPEDDWI
ncbi:cupin domain-containing protein [Aestuariispira insulae]|uniref:Mannose-6-phosphate isomerase-like protein (Cupin superfamily) n=1 Tax=Aestuariispira insulae TaxID=1461337 RepID=A0A3D9HSN4_9PROT|nr:cupin domain-containing protein [Aestuariispira insulae]RED52518.1 mannose-6-phosphate isomerase-like protein (cupin superfamily) [Aestuariispira insulae]